MKKLEINGKLIAYYRFSDTTDSLLHIKLVASCPENVQPNEFENWIAGIISFIEQKEVTDIGYLNI
jgi:hypothetical protein